MSMLAGVETFSPGRVATFLPCTISREQEDLIRDNLGMKDSDLGPCLREKLCMEWTQCAVVLTGRTENPACCPAGWP